MTDDAEPKHTYPSSYGKGVHPDLDAAWEILDTIKPGLIDDDVRAFLAGAMAGLMERARNENRPGSDPGRNQDS